MIKEVFHFIVLFLLLFILGICIVILWNVRLGHCSDYKTPSWQKRAITNYNYNQAVSGKRSETIENDRDAPSWQRRAIDSYNYDKATHRQRGRNNEREN
jgi:hypothetical protein